MADGDLVEDLRALAEAFAVHKDMAADALRAADETECLRAQVAELLPFAHADARLGASVAQQPGGHDCEPVCDDCQWHLDSVALLARIESGEFGQPGNG